MLFDILIIGIFILWMTKRGEKKLENKRYKEEIDDFRGWESNEASHRIAGNIRRLNRNGVTSIALARCYLVKADLQGADLQGANLRGANLQRAKNLLTGQLSEVYTLHHAQLDTPLLAQIEEAYPHLLEKPRDVF